MHVTNRKGWRIDKEKKGEHRLTENKVNYGMSMEKMRGVGGHRSEKVRQTSIRFKDPIASSSPPTNGIWVADKCVNSSSVERQLGKEVVGTGAKKGDDVQTVTRSPSEVSQVFAKKNVASNVISEMEGVGLNNPMVGDVASKEVVFPTVVTLPTLNHRVVQVIARKEGSSDALDANTGTLGYGGNSFSSAMDRRLLKIKGIAHKNLYTPRRKPIERQENVNLNMVVVGDWIASTSKTLDLQIQVDPANGATLTVSNGGIDRMIQQQKEGSLGDGEVAL
ncbi:hypothetical protein V6N12_068070 [Hibiscus sabdariffa]|uniref:Uncharacterized protein n=1 Tax=Hibiscus sabdariffa TaxID=183260 RepID=A0ABR2FNX7_9ROSI